MLYFRTINVLHKIKRHSLAEITSGLSLPYIISHFINEDEAKAQIVEAFLVRPLKQTAIDE